MREDDIYLSESFQHSEKFANESSLAYVLEMRCGWNAAYAKEIADIAWNRLYTDSNPSLSSDSTDTRLLDLIRDLHTSDLLLPVLRGLPHGDWMLLYNAVIRVAEGD